MPSSDQELEEAKGEKMSYVTATGEMVYKGTSAWENIRKHMRALQLTKTQPRVTSAAKELMTAGQVSTRSYRQVQKAFGGTALAMTKRGLVKQGAGNVLLLGQDIYTLWEDWKDLKAEPPTELAKELRMRAKEHERVVSEQTRRYKELKKVRAGFWKGLGDKLGSVEPCRTARVKGGCVCGCTCLCYVEKFAEMSLSRLPLQC